MHRQLGRLIRRAPHPCDRLLTADRPVDGRLAVRGPPPGNDLFDLFVARFDAAVADRAARWALVGLATKALSGLLEGLGQLHALGFAHGDVKPENAVVNMVNGRPLVQLIDFGAAAPTTRQGAADWETQHRRRYFLDGGWLPGRRRERPVPMADPMGGGPADYCRLGAPSARDDVFRALAGYHRMVTRLDPAAAAAPAWPDSRLFRPGGMRRLTRDSRPEPMPTDRLIGAIRSASAGDQSAEADVGRGLAAASPAQRLVARAEVEVALMMLRCLNVAARCCPDNAARASARAALSRLFRLPDG
jgi:hypothetical protein